MTDSTQSTPIPVSATTVVVTSPLAELTTAAHQLGYKVMLVTDTDGYVDVMLTSSDLALPVADLPRTYVNFDGSDVAMPAYDACISSHEPDGKPRIVSISTFTADLDALITFARKSFLELAFKAVA